MQITETNAEGLKHEFKVVVPAHDIAHRVAGRIAQMGKTARIPGFRPGKAPAALLKQRFGQQVRGEVLQETLNESSQKAVQDKGLRPALRPRIKITNYAEGADLEYELSVEVLPEIAPGELTDLELERPVVAVGDAEIDEALGRIARNNKRFQAAPEDHGSAAGDQVVIDYLGTLGGVEFAGGRGTDQAVEIGAGMLLPDLENALADRRKGDAFEVDVRFPDTYAAENLKGKAAHFQVTIKDLKVREATVVDDAFAKQLGLDDLAALRADVAKRMTEDYGQLSRARVKRQLLDRLAERFSFPVPTGMVNLEFDAIWRQVKGELDKAAARDHEHDHGHAGHDHDHDHAGHDHAGHDPGAPAEPVGLTAEEIKLQVEYRAIAERRVRLGLLLADIGRRNGIEVSNDDLSRSLMARARGFPGQERKVFDYYTKNPSAMQELRAPLFEDKVVDHILSLAKVVDRTVSIAELMREPDDETAAGGET